MQELTSLFETLSLEEPSFRFQKEIRQKIDLLHEEKSFVAGSFKRALLQTSKIIKDRSTQVMQENKIDGAYVLDFVDESSKGSYLVFVDGILRMDLSNITAIPSACAILPTSKALKIYGPVLTSRYKVQNKDPLEIFHLAHFQEGVVIYVPAKLTIENPLQIILLHSEDTSSKTIALPRIDLVLGKMSCLDLYLTAPCREAISCITMQNMSIASLQASVEEGAFLSICDTLFSKAGSIHFYDFLLKKEAKVSMTNINYHSLAYALHAVAVLEGEHANFDIKGLSTLHPYAEGMANVLVEHKAKTTQSSQHFKQILSAGAKSTFEGKIYVHSEALLSESYQRSQALLLSDHTYVVSKPNLEIFADDVKASHGATIASLREEELHYLRTRGLSEEEAKKLLIEGFAKEIVQDVSYEAVQKELSSSLQTLSSPLCKS